MEYKFGEYIKKKESDFLKTKVTNSDLIRIYDANNYFEMYKKHLTLNGVVNSMPTFKGINNLKVGETIVETEKYKILKR